VSASLPILRVLEDGGALASAACAEVQRAAEQALERRGRFHLALAGGRTPRGAYALLARRGPAAGFGGWHLWFGDERCVPPDHEDSNFRMVEESWLIPAGFPPANVHRLRGEAPPEEEAVRYAGERVHELGSPPRLDLVLLGLGADGHTASLFPGDGAADGSIGLVRVAHAPVEPRLRLTLTPSAFAGAGQALFLVAGADKAQALAAVLSGQGTPERYPALSVRPAGRRLWLADRAAAARVPTALRAALERGTAGPDDPAAG